MQWPQPEDLELKTYKNDFDALLRGLLDEMRDWMIAFISCYPCSDVQAQVQFNEKLFLFTDRFNKRLYATSSIFEAVGIWIHIGALHIEKLKIAHKTIGRASLLLLFSIYVASTIIGTMAKAPEEFTKPDWVIHLLHASVSVIHSLLIVNPQMSPVQQFFVIIITTTMTLMAFSVSAVYMSTSTLLLNKARICLFAFGHSAIFIFLNFFYLKQFNTPEPNLFGTNLQDDPLPLDRSYDQLLCDKQVKYR